MEREEVEKERLLIEHRSNLAMVQIESDKLRSKKLEEIKAVQELKYLQAKNAIKQKFYSKVVRSIQDEEQKYKIIKERELKEAKESYEKEIETERRLIVTALNQQTQEMTQHERIVKDLKALKQTTKEQRNKKASLQHEIELEALMIQKMKVNLETTKVSIQEGAAGLKGKEREQYFEKELKEKDEELKLIKQDIDRVLSFQALENLRNQGSSLAGAQSLESEVS